MSDLKLQAIESLISDFLASKTDMLLSTKNLLDKVLDIISYQEDIDNKEESMTDENKETKEIKTSEKKEDKKIVISCDASIKTNPGGPASVGVVIRFPDQKAPIKLAKVVPSKTNNEAEYDAVYEGLSILANTVNTPRFPIVVMSDSQLVVKQLQGIYKINEETLQRKFESIHALAAKIPALISIEWRPRNSTPDLTDANFLAQDALGVKRH